MDILYACCAGLDVHKETVVVTVRRRLDNGKVQQQTRTYGTMTEQLLELADWLEAQGVTHLAMESTGVYWKPIWNLLEDRFEILLVNAQHIKHVPGRKTDVTDSEWIAQLLQCGLLRGSFVPPAPQRELRELTRQRRQLVHATASVANRIQKVLEDANIKLGSVATDLRRSLHDIPRAGCEKHTVSSSRVAGGRVRRGGYECSARTPPCLLGPVPLELGQFFSKTLVFRFCGCLASGNIISALTARQQNDQHNDARYKPSKAQTTDKQDDHFLHSKIEAEYPEATPKRQFSVGPKE